MGWQNNQQNLFQQLVHALASGGKGKKGWGYNVGWEGSGKSTGKGQEKAKGKSYGKGKGDGKGDKGKGKGTTGGWAWGQSSSVVPTGASLTNPEWAADASTTSPLPSGPWICSACGELHANEKKKSCRFCHLNRFNKKENTENATDQGIKPKVVALVNQYAPLSCDRVEGVETSPMDGGDDAKDKYHARKTFLQTMLEEAKLHQEESMAKHIENQLSNLKEPSPFQDVKDGTLLNQELLKLNSGHAKVLNTFTTAATEADDQLVKLEQDQSKCLERLSNTRTTWHTIKQITLKLFWM